MSSLKNSALKVVSSPGVRKAAIVLVLAVLGALGFNVSVGCGAVAVPALPPEVSQAVEAGNCAHDLLKGVDPEALSIAQARELAKALKACAKPAPSSDAGAE
jgi:hypothetical protein